MSDDDDVRRMYDKEFLYAYDLDGKSVVLTIASVKAGEVVGDGGKKSKKPVITFEKTPKKLALNHTNKKIIGAMYGFKAKGWAGKRIEIYPTTTKFGPDVVDCIRVRPGIPPAKEPSK